MYQLINDDEARGIEKQKERHYSAAPLCLMTVKPPSATPSKFGEPATDVRPAVKAAAHSPNQGQLLHTQSTTRSTKM